MILSLSSRHSRSLPSDGCNASSCAILSSHQSWLVSIGLLLILSKLVPVLTCLVKDILHHNARVVLLDEWSSVLHENQEGWHSFRSRSWLRLLLLRLLSDIILLMMLLLELFLCDRLSLHLNILLCIEWLDIICRLHSWGEPSWIAIFHVVYDCYPNNKLLVIYVYLLF